MEKISKYTQFFDLMLIGDELSNKNLYQLTHPYFRSVRQYGFEELTKKLPLCHMVFISGGFNDIFNNDTKNVLGTIQRLETVIFTDDVGDIAFFKEALLLRSSHVGSNVTNELELSHVLVPILPIMIKKHNDTHNTYTYRQVVEHSSTLYWIHKHKKSIYANDAFKNFFGFSTLADFDKRVTSLDLIESSTLNKRKLRDTQKHEYSVLSESIPLTHDETLMQITLLPENNEKKESIFLNRITFIEVLKDAFIIHKNEYEPIPVVIMIIDNQSKITEEFGESGYNDACKEILNLTKKHFGALSKVALWHKDIFLLSDEGSTLEELKQALERLHENIVSHIYAQRVVPVLESYVLDLSKLELNRAINVIDNIHSRNLISSDLTNLIYHEIFFDDGTHSMKDQAIYYLEKLFLSKSQVKLLNFYKGIRINTLGRIVKISDGMVYMGIEKIQGYAMQLEKNVVIQATNLPFDISAEIKLVDIAKKIAVFYNFEPLRASANNREHIRIQSDHRMHVTISALKHVISATILDISIKSIACRVNNGRNIPPKGSLVSMQFHLPSKRFEEGSVSMLLTGHVEFIQEAHDFTKVVILLDLEEPYESFLIEYIYTRQQELVGELKSIVNKL